MSSPFCRVCSATVADGVCTLCGSTYAVAEATATPPPPPAAPPTAQVAPAPAPAPPTLSTPPTSRPTSAIIAGAVAVMALVGVGGFLWSMQAGRPAPAVSSSTSPDRGAASRSIDNRAPTTSAPAEVALPRASTGTWIAVLESLPKSEFTQAEALAKASSMSSLLSVADIDATPGLNGGYWAIVVLDQPSRAAAASACTRVGREVGPLCYPREIR